jgi:hypothetical protein
LSLHESIATAMQRYIEDRADCAVISPAAMAVAAYDAFADASVEAHIQYGALEHFKGMARKVLAGRFSDDGEENAAYAGQGELFSGHLQERYPLPRKAGTEPTYKLRHLLTAEERAWNVKLLRKSADARLAHADALEAEGISQAAA